MPAVNGAKIRETRRGLGLKLGQFAAKSGVKTKTLANIESRSQSASIEVITRIAAALGVEPGDLLQDADPPEGVPARRREDAA